MTTLIKIRKNHIKLLLIFFSFIGPLIFSFLYFYQYDEYLERNTTNHSTLISPVVAISPFSDTSIDGSVFTLDSLKHIWTIIHFNTVSCNDYCQKFLYNTRQARIAVGKDANRIQRILITPRYPFLNLLMVEHEDLLVIIDNNSELKAQLKLLFINKNIDLSHAVLIDPLGHVMMQIPQNLNPSYLLKDLKRLLKLSRIG